LFVHTVEKVMETRFLDTFLLVARHGSLVEAARLLGLTPAAVTQRVKALEAEIGTALLVRSGRRVKPTEAGHSILDHAAQVLGDVQRLRAAAVAALPMGELRIGAISTAMTGILPRALRRMRDRMPQVEFFLLPGTSSGLYRALCEGQLDVALVVRPPFALPKTQTATLVRTDRFMLLAPAAQAHRTAAELLATEPFIRYDRNNWGGRLVQSWLDAQGLTPRDWIELDQLEAIAVMVSRGLGVSILPDWAPPWPEGVDGARLPLPGSDLVRHVDAIWTRDTPTERLSRALVESLG
jgi:DNA-binding transcriptional LysR family regulator